MKLYHGSTIDIVNIDLAQSKPNKDFGRSFRSSATSVSRLTPRSGRTSSMTTVPSRMDGRSTTTTSSTVLLPTTASAHRLPGTSRVTSPSTSSCVASSTSKASLSNTPSAPSRLLTNSRKSYEHIAGRIPEHEGGDCERPHRPSDGRARFHDAAGFRCRLYLAPLRETQRPQDRPLFPKLRLRL